MADRSRACRHGHRNAGFVLSSWRAARPFDGTMLESEHADERSLACARATIGACGSASRLRSWPASWPTSSSTHHPRFTLEAIFGFGAWFGFLSCTALVLFAKALGTMLRRPEGYYDE